MLSIDYGIIFAEQVLYFLLFLSVGKYAGYDVIDRIHGNAVDKMEQKAHKHSIHAAIRLLVPANKRHEAFIILNSVIEQIRLEEGCISCRLYQDLQEEGALMLEEIWLSQSDLERHLRTDKFRTVLLVVEMAIEYPEIRFNTIAHTTGMETIQRLRE